MHFDIIKYLLCFSVIICCCENDGNMVTKKYFFCGGLEFEEQDAARKINAILPAGEYDPSSLIIYAFSGDTAKCVVIDYSDKVELASFVINVATEKIIDKKKCQLNSEQIITMNSIFDNYRPEFMTSVYPLEQIMGGTTYVVRVLYRRINIFALRNAGHILQNTHQMKFLAAIDNMLKEIGFCSIL